MGVMEFPATATVEILDPNDGQCNAASQHILGSDAEYSSWPH